jgi:hypothetical protein
LFIFYLSASMNNDIDTENFSVVAPPAPPPNNAGARTLDAQKWIGKGLLPQWRISRANLPASPTPVKCSNEPSKQYEGCPLLQSMLQSEDRRTSQLEKEGRHQSEYPKSNEGWIRTLFIYKGRALDRIAFPWSISLVHTIVYTVLQESYLPELKNRNAESWEFFFGLVLNSTLSFLLVFRLQRAANRYWDARALWGMIIAKSRCFMGSVVAHSDHNLAQRDEAVRWLVAFVVTTMELLRGVKKLPADNLAGLLSQSEIDMLDQSTHPPIFACDMVRTFLPFFRKAVVTMSPRLSTYGYD